MRLYVRAEERRPDPPPLDTDLRLPIIVGIGVWTVLFVLALMFKGRLDDRGLDWWVWTPLIGALLGAYGLQMVHARNKREQRAGGQAEQAKAAAAATDGPADRSAAPEAPGPTAAGSALGTSRESADR